MEVENLTTGDNDPQVNETKQVDNSVVPEEQVSSDTNTPADDNTYNDAWDKIDLNDDATLDRVFDDTTADEQVNSDESNGGINPLNDVSTNETNNSIGAFMVDKPVLKYKGKEVPIDNADELLALAQKGFSYETEMSNIKPKKKLLSIIEGVPLEILQAVADLNSGKKEAIKYLKSEYGIVDTKPANSDESIWGSSDEESVAEQVSDYTPSVKADDPVAEFFSEFTTTNPSVAAKVNEVYSSLDDSFKNDLYEINTFPKFAAAVESGEFDAVYPIAMKEKALNPAISWIQAYGMAVQKIQSGTKAPEVTEPPADVTPPKNIDRQRGISDNDAADRVWNDPEYYKELEAKLFG